MPTTVTEPARPRPAAPLRFSVRSLLIFVVMAGCGIGVWLRREPWGLTRVLAHDSVHSAGFSPDGKLLITSGRDARAWDTASGKQLGVMTHEKARFHGPRFSRDSTRATFMHNFGGICTTSVWDLRTWKKLNESADVRYNHEKKTFAGLRTTRKEGNNVDSIEVDPPVDFNFKLSSPPESPATSLFTLGVAQIMDGATGKPIAVLPQEEKVTGGSLSDDELRAVTFGEKHAYLWHRRRPEHWSGIAWLPELWLALLLLPALCWSLWRDRAVVNINTSSAIGH